MLEAAPETGDWSVWCPELPGCVSAGEIKEEALKNIREIFLQIRQTIIVLSHQPSLTPCPTFL